VASGRLSALSALEIELAGRGPPIESELRVLIRQISTENQLWGAPRIHGELLKLGFSVAHDVKSYFVPRFQQLGPTPPSAKLTPG
jgi:hypothetical protein